MSLIHRHNKWSVADLAVYSRYEAASGLFTCLDGSRTIPLSAINDDYCDCPDGSDEPGTSACENSSVQFYCKNEGHIPGSVRASRVNDGICGELASVASSSGD